QEQDQADARQPVEEPVHQHPPPPPVSVPPRGRRKRSDGGLSNGKIAQSRMEREPRIPPPNEADEGQNQPSARAQHGHFSTLPRGPRPVFSGPAARAPKRPRNVRFFAEFLYTYPPSLWPVRHPYFMRHHCGDPSHFSRNRFEVITWPNLPAIS